MKDIILLALLILFAGGFCLLLLIGLSSGPGYDLQSGFATWM